jgi:hypothetical protein
MKSADTAAPIEEKFWTAKEWAMRTRVPYRSILAAAARGDLAAVRPSGTSRGAILISEASWAAWIRRSRLPTRLKRPSPKQASGTIRDLALR